MTIVGSDEFEAARRAKELSEEHAKLSPEGVGRACGVRAAKHIMAALRADSETLDRFVELIRAADPETFRACLLELHQKALEEYRRYPDEVK